MDKFSKMQTELRTFWSEIVCACGGKMIVNENLALNQSPEGLMYWHICDTCKASACILGKHPRIGYAAISSPISEQPL
jgi:hypothetical protein